ncbi:MAG: nucleotidyltransferase family protein [Castellaniella sp.]
MRAMILAAGRGERMRPLTDHLPKPLLEVGGQPLIVWHLKRLARAGFRDVIINHAWLGACIEAVLGHGGQFGLRLHYSPETEALETAGGIARALPFFENRPFLVINGDVWCDWDPAGARQWQATLERRGALAGLLMVSNPAHRPDGDFLPLSVPAGQAWFPLVLRADDTRAHTLTFAGIGVYQPALFEGIGPDTRQPLAPLLRQAMTQQGVIGWRHEGDWVDVGTPARLTALNTRLSQARHAGYTLL